MANSLKNHIHLDTSSGRGDNLVLNVYPNRTYLKEEAIDNKLASDVPVNITTATSITPSGKLWNITTSLDNDTIHFQSNNITNETSDDNTPYSIGMEVKPIKGLAPRNYTLTISARYETVTYSKIIDLVVTE